MILRQRKIEKAVRQGFTLMEVLVVVAIILILASLGGYYLIGQANEARKSGAKAQIRVLTTAVENYELNYMQKPGNLAQLLVKGERGGPYLKNRDALIDPWGREYQYNPQGPRNGGTQPDIWSMTPEGQEIGNWASKGITEP